MSTKTKLRKWTPDDDTLLCQVVAKNTSPVGQVCWRRVALSFPGRQDSRCRERWYNVLDPMVNRDPWTPEEDRKILELYQELGHYSNKWVTIAKKLGTHRTGDNLKHHAAKLLKNSVKQSTLQGSRDIRHYFGFPGESEKDKPSNAAMVSDDETSASALLGKDRPHPDEVPSYPLRPCKPIDDCPVKAAASTLPKTRNNRRKEAIFLEKERAMLIAAMKVDPRAEVEDQHDLRAGWREQERLRNKKLWFPTGGWKAPLWNVMEAGEATRSKAAMYAKESKITQAEKDKARAIKEGEMARLEEKLLNQDADTVADSDHIVWAIEYLKQKKLKRRPSKETPATTVANLIDTHMPAGPMLVEGQHEEKLTVANNHGLHQAVAPIDLKGVSWREHEGTKRQANGMGTDAEVSDTEIRHRASDATLSNKIGIPVGQLHSFNSQDRKRKRNDEARNDDADYLPKTKRQFTQRVSSTMKLQDVRYPSFLPPCDALLIRAHAAMYDLLPRGDCESIRVLRMAASYYKYWRPKEGRTKVILLAESHGFTTEDRPGLDPNLLTDYDGPRGFIPLVYSFGYGENEALCRLHEDVRPPVNSGTSQFWTLLTACSRDTTTLPAAVKDPNKMASPFAADILKGGRLSVEQRLKAKLEVLMDLQRRGIWLLDASVFGWYVSQAQQYTRSKETGEIHRIQKTRPPKHLKGPSLVLAWEMFTKHLVHEVAQEGGLNTVVTIGKDVERLLTRKRIKEAAGNNCTIESWPAPNAWVEGGYTPWHHTISKLMRELAPPLQARGTLQNPIGI